MLFIIIIFLWLAITKDLELVLFTKTREEQSFSVCNIYERTKCLLDSIIVSLSLSRALNTDLLGRRRRRRRRTITIAIDGTYNTANT